jgi:hypothetical protein
MKKVIILKVDINANMNNNVYILEDRAIIYIMVKMLKIFYKIL